LCVFATTLTRQAVVIGLSRMASAMLFPLLLNLVGMVPTLVILRRFNRIALLWQESGGRLCMRCTYDLRGASSRACPECGHAVPPAASCQAARSDADESA
jgi:hypothetical protein